MEGTSRSLALTGNNGAMKGWINAQVSRSLNHVLLAPCKPSFYTSLFMIPEQPRQSIVEFVDSEVIPQLELPASICLNIPA